MGINVGKGTCMIGATPSIYGGKKEVGGEIVTPTCLCDGTYIHIHVFMY